MRALEQHEIAEADHRILNPITEDKLMLLGEVCRLSAGMRQLDLACGKGEMLCRWAHRYGTSGHGVDISEAFLAAARARADELGVADRVTFQHGDAADAVPDDGSYDVVSCIGATWIGAGLTGTIALIRPALSPDGLLLVGHPFWHEPPPPAAPAAFGVSEDTFATLDGTLDLFESAGVELVEMVTADGDSWDRYEAAKWWTVERWLRAHPDHPDAGQMRDFLVDNRRTYLRHLRRYLGWAVFVLRLP